MKKYSLGDRQKTYYEDRNRYYLTRRTPIIIRIDGQAFHTLTRKCDKPFDERIRSCLVYAAIELFKVAQGAKMAYVQSDEISVVITDYDTLLSGAWFDYNVQKISSISASIVTAYFNIPWLGEWFDDSIKKRPGTFDARCWNIPMDDVANYFLWRIKDWERNSLSMLSRSEYSHKELSNKKKADMHEMLYSKGINWADLEPKWKNGTFIYRDGREIIEDSTVLPNYESITKVLQRVGFFNG